MCFSIPQWLGLESNDSNGAKEVLLSQIEVNSRLTAIDTSFLRDCNFRECKVSFFFAMLVGVFSGNKGMAENQKPKMSHISSKSCSVTRAIIAYRATIAKGQ
jgi:hypothetical protein